MIPLPPSPFSMVMGIAYALRLAIGRGHGDFTKPSAKAVWDALWFRFLLIAANGMLVVGFDHANAIPLLLAVALCDTLFYPVLSHFTLQAIGMSGRFPLFIMAMTWFGNLRIILLMVILLALGGGQNPLGTTVLVVVGFWLVWATWSIASRSLGDRGWLGVGMLMLMMFAEILNAGVVVSFVHPLVAGAEQ